MPEATASTLAMAQSENCHYTRYADDLVFSGINPGSCINLIKRILLSEGFTPHPEKTRIMRRGGRQQVTGLVVNHHPSLPREEVRQLRAILQNARKTGLAAQNREGRPHFVAWLRGRLAYLSMVDPEKGGRMLAQLNELETRD